MEVDGVRSAPLRPNAWRESIIHVTKNHNLDGSFRDHCDDKQILEQIFQLMDLSCAVCAQIVPLWSESVFRI